MRAHTSTGNSAEYCRRIEQGARKLLLGPILLYCVNLISRKQETIMNNLGPAFFIGLFSL